MILTDTADKAKEAKARKKTLLKFFGTLYRNCKPEHGSIVLVDKSQNKRLGFFSCTDIEGMADSLLGSIPEIGAYFKFNTFDAEAIGSREESWKQAIGGKAELINIVMLTADVDCGKSGKYGTREEALRAISKMPLPPTMIVSSKDGEGLHVYWVLESPVPTEEQADYEYAEGISKGWHALLRTHLTKLDDNFGLERHLRVPGPRTDGGKVTILEMTGCYYDLDSFVEFLPKEKPATAKASSNGKANPKMPDGSSMFDSSTPVEDYIAAEGITAESLLVEAKYSELPGGKGEYLRPGSESGQKSVTIATDNPAFPGINIWTSESEFHQDAKTPGDGCFVSLAAMFVRLKFAGDWHSAADWCRDELKPKSAEPAKATKPLEAYVPFPVHLLPAALSQFVKQAAKSTNCDPAFIAMPLLSCLGAAIGNSTRLVVKKDWLAPPNIWTAIVADSGQTKSPALRMATEALADVEKVNKDSHKVAMSEFKGELQAWKDGDKKKRGAEPEPPKMERHIVSDITVEALAAILQDNDRGLLLLRDELSGWFGSFNQYKGGKGADEAHWLSMFDGDSLTVDRKGSISEPVYVESALVTVSGSIQPRILSKALSEDHMDSGMAARLLFAYPPKSVVRWNDTVVADSVKNNISKLMKSLLGLKRNEIDKPVQVRWSGDAKKRFIRFYNDHHAEQFKKMGDDAAAWSKLIGYSARFALVLHVAKCCLAGESIKTPVAADTLEEAIGLVDWFKLEVSRVYEVLGDTAEQNHLRQFAEWITRTKGGICTPSQLSSGNRSARPVEKAEQICTDLVKAGLAEWQTDETTEKGGRPKRSVLVL